MIWESPVAIARASLLLALVALAACGDEPKLITASFHGPSGMTLAGSDHNRLFITNSGEDTLQILKIGKDLGSAEFVRGAAIHFPLRVEVGPQPDRLASTPDGRYVA